MEDIDFPRFGSVRYNILLLILCFCFQVSYAPDWQWSVPFTGKKGPTRVFLWIPPDCKQVRGVILAQHNMEEISILEDPNFREEMGEIGFAEVEENVLRYTKIPPKAKYPLKVTVIAWQYGRSFGQKLKSAQPVERSFFITN